MRIKLFKYLEIYSIKVERNVSDKTTSKGWEIAIAGSVARQ